MSKETYILVRAPDEEKKIPRIGAIPSSASVTTDFLHPSIECKEWATSSTEQKNALLIKYNRATMPAIVSMSRGKRKLNNLRTKMTVGASVTGAAATAYTTVINIRPGATSEYSNAAAMYDEVKVHGGVLHYIWRINTGSSSEGTAAMGIIVYDPLLNSALASIENGVQHSQHQFCALPQNDAVPGQTAIVATTGDSYQHFRFRCPGDTQRVPGTASVCTGQWCDTTTTTADWGYLKPYINAVSGQTFMCTYSLELDCEFRSRS